MSMIHKYVSIYEELKRRLKISRGVFFRIIGQINSRKVALECAISLVSIKGRALLIRIELLILNAVQSFSNGISYYGLLDNFAWSLYESTYYRSIFIRIMCFLDFIFTFVTSLLFGIILYCKKFDCCF
jgi:hypothetical protein